MNWKVLARRSKKPTEKVSIKQKDGTIKTKCKKKKRFGKSVNRHSPGLLTELIKQKGTRYDVPIIEIDTRKYRASQYNHVTDKYEKPALSDRTKMIGGHRVQRDCYSSWLTRNAEDETRPSKETCEKDFKHFLKMQGKAVQEQIRKGDNTKNFGLKDFLTT